MPEIKNKFCKFVKLTNKYLYLYLHLTLSSNEALTLGKCPRQLTKEQQNTTASRLLRISFCQTFVDNLNE